MARKLGQEEDRGPIVQVQGGKREEAIPGMSSRFGWVAQSTCVYGSGICAWTVREGPNQDDFTSHTRARSDWEFSKQPLSSCVEALLDRSQSGG